MSRVNSGGYGHRIRKERHDEYVISWRYDVPMGRLRSTRRFTRDTNEAGAKRFAKRWNLEMPK